MLCGENAHGNFRKDLRQIATETLLSGPTFLRVIIGNQHPCPEPHYFFFLSLQLEARYYINYLWKLLEKCSPTNGPKKWKKEYGQTCLDRQRTPATTNNTLVLKILQKRSIS